MKSFIISSAVVALLTFSASAQVVVDNTTIPTNGTNGTVVIPVPVVPVVNETNGTDVVGGDNSTDNGTVVVDNSTDNGTGAVDNGTIIENNGTGTDNSTDNGTDVVPPPTGGSNIVIIEPSGLIPCQATNQTQCAFVLGTEFCCIQASGNLISDNSLFNQQFCYNQTLLDEQRASPLQYGNDVNLNTLACLGGNFLQLTGAAFVVGAATLLF